MSEKYTFYSNCVDWPRGDVNREGGLRDMIDDAIDITRRTFLKYVDPAEIADIEQNLGYARHPSQGLTMAGDCHVTYHRSKLHGKRCYFFCHSAIEHVFTKRKSSS